MADIEVMMGDDDVGNGGSDEVKNWWRLAVDKPMGMKGQDESTPLLFIGQYFDSIVCSIF